MTTPSDLMPGAEPFFSEGGPVGVLVLHGFTGNPQSMRPLADALARAGHTVSLPLLPGHGTRVEDMVPTRWEDWSAAAESALTELASRCASVCVAGLSMGGTLTLWLASRHPELRGIVLINALADGAAPGITATVKQLGALDEPLVPGVGSDIAAEGVVESAYPLMPVQGLLSLHGALAGLQLEQIRCPVLLMTSPQDHVVEPVSSDLVASSVAGPVERVSLDRSFHVATLDHDASLLEERAVDFVRRVTAA